VPITHFSFEKPPTASGVHDDITIDDILYNRIDCTFVNFVQNSASGTTRVYYCMDYVYRNIRGQSLALLELSKLLSLKFFNYKELIKDRQEKANKI